MENGISLTQLQAFQAILQTRSVSEAAKLMGISQPAVSSTIGRLEKELGFKLFAREYGKMIPTADAARIAAATAMVTKSVGDLQRIAHQHKTGHNSSLDVAAQPLIAHSVLPKVIALFMQEKPECVVRVTSCSSDDVRCMVEDGLTEIGLADVPIAMSSAITEIYPLRCKVIFPVGHRLSKLQKVTPKDLQGEPMISQSTNREIYHKIRRIFFDSNVRIKVVAEVDCFSIARGIVASGGGVAIVDAFTAMEDSPGSKIESLPFEPEVLYECSCYLPRHRTLSAPAQRFMNIFREQIGNSAL